MFKWFLNSDKDSSSSGNKNRTDSRDSIKSKDFTSSERSSDFLYYSFDKAEEREQKALEEGVTIAKSLPPNYLRRDLDQNNQDEYIANMSKSTPLFEENEVVAEVVPVSDESMFPFFCLCICSHKGNSFEDDNKYSQHYFQNPELLKVLIGDVQDPSSMS